MKRAWVYAIRIDLAAILLVTFLSSSRFVSAASLAFDSAADPAYNSGWSDGSNGGYGWGGGWQFSGVGDKFIASSTTNGGASIDTQGRSWGQSTDINPFGGRAIATATRPFSGELRIGQSFVIDFDQGVVTNAPVGGGVDIQLGGQFGTAFHFEANTHSGGYGIQDGIGNPNFFSLPLAQTQGLRLVFTLTSPTNYTFSIYSVETSSLLLATNGSMGFFYIQSITNSISEVTLETINGGLDPQNWNFFNNMAIIPEPGTVALVGLGLPLAMLLRRRTRRS